MGHQRDRLYSIFERNLHDALVENESTSAFLDRVVQEYLVQIGHSTIILAEHRFSIEEDLRDEVGDMLRKKIYGHYSLQEFQRSRKLSLVSPTAEVRNAATSNATSKDTSNDTALVPAGTPTKGPAMGRAATGGLAPNEKVTSASESFSIFERLRAKRLRRPN